MSSIAPAIALRAPQTSNVVRLAPPVVRAAATGPGVRHVGLIAMLAVASATFWGVAGRLAGIF